MASEYTTNFNLDLYTDTDKPNLRDQYNGAMRKVDAQLLVNSNNTTSALTAAQQANEIVNDLKTNEISAIKSNIAVNAESIAKNAESIAKNADGLANANDKITANQNSIKTLQSSVSANTSDITDLKTTVASQQTSIDDIFPITSSKIAAGAVTRDKLDSQALESLLRGASIRYFDNKDSSADNTGLVCPGTSNIKGYYIPELTLLVIQARMNKNDLGRSYNDGETGIKLPNYIPNPTKVSIEFGCAIGYSSTSDFVSWTGFGMRKDLSIGVNSFNANATDFITMSPCIVFLRAFGVD